MTTRPALTVRPADPADREWIESFLARHNSTRGARRGELLAPIEHPMLVAIEEAERVGLITYILGADACEVLTLHADRQWHGAGSALLHAVAGVALDAGCSRLWLVTTNDNTDALRFYQRRGFRLRALYPGAVDASRRELKPEIPWIGDHGIPLRDEIELDLELTESRER